MSIKSIYANEQWVIIQEKKENGQGITYKYKNGNNIIIYSFIKREAGVIDGVQYYDILTARGESGPRIEKYNGENISRFVLEFHKDFDNYCIEHNIIAEYVRFDPWNDQCEYFKERYSISYYGDLYCNNLTVDFFMMEYSPQKRTDIRKAQNKSIEIKFDFKGETLDGFLELYDNTVRKYSLGSYYYLEKEFLVGYFKILKDQVFIVNAIYEGVVISSAVFLLGEDIAHYHFSGSDPEYRSLQSNSLIIYEASIHAKKLGKKLMDLGGAKKGSPLESFKSSFIKKVEPYHYNVGTRICNNSIYTKLVEIVGGPREGFFPEYRR